MVEHRLADERASIQSAIDLLTRLTSGHSLRLVHGVSTRELVAARDELLALLERRESDVK